MPLQSPNLDDRDFEQLVEEAKRRIQQSCPEWTDLSPSDPGMVLLELFAFLTESMIYRLNRIPEKAFIEFLRLIGVRLQPPAAAGATLAFSRAGESDQKVEIPRGTRVTLSRSDGGGEPPVFTTARTVTILPGETSVDVRAYHCDLVEAELAGLGTGQPGLTVTAQQPPIVEPTGEPLDLVVGVEALADELDEPVPVIPHEDKVYRIWREVDNFTNLGADRWAYVADRMAGTIQFAPAARIRQDGALQDIPTALAEVPLPGREIRLWYRSGGGPSGNVVAGTLTVLKDDIPGIEVTNPRPAAGGQSAESQSNALIRGPQELHSLRRAVTARDFELAALDSSQAVIRAKAFTRAALWAHAVPGTVEVLLVPYLPEEERGQGVTLPVLQERGTEEVREHVQRALDERRPLGIGCVVNWAHYKVVRIAARIVVRSEASPTALRERVLERLYRTITPVPTKDTLAWPFGEALRASHVYDIALREGGVLWIDRVKLLVEEAPGKDVRSIAADAFQSNTWYTGSEDKLFRSLNGGRGWERVGQFSGEEIVRVCTHSDRAGLLAVVTALPDGDRSRVRISMDCAESWEDWSFAPSFLIRDAAWAMRGDTPMLLLATDVGLFEWAMRAGSNPAPILVDPGVPDLGFRAVTATRTASGQAGVAVAARDLDGVYLSSEGGQASTFRHIELRGKDVRVLAVQYDGSRSFLWAGMAAVGGEAGEGCSRWELRGQDDPPEGWQAFSADWEGGSCRDLAFLGTTVFSATHRAGVTYLDVTMSDARWQAPDVNCGLPLRDPGRFHPVDAVAANPEGHLLMAGGIEGVYRSEDKGLNYLHSSDTEFAEKVTLPATWLFCSGEHDLEVISQDEANAD